MKNLLSSAILPSAFCLLSSAFFCCSASADEKQAYLGIFAETRIMKVVGMPDMSEMLKNMPAIPGMPKIKMPGQPSRDLTVRLWSPGIAPDDATASLAIPAGLKLESPLKLSIYRPKAEGGETVAAPGEIDPDKIPTFTIKRYWGSSTTVKEGQPEVVTWGNLTPEQKSIMREQQRKARNTSSYFYKPDWTTAYWPGQMQPGQMQPSSITDDAALPGDYTLTSSYTGNVKLTAPAEVNFLAPINITAPALAAKPDLTQALRFKWAPIAHALGLHAQIMGMQGTNTLIMWDSAEIKPGMGINWSYLQMSEVRDLVKQTAMMPGTATAVDVPAGIFKDADNVFMTMIGYGPGAATEGQPTPRIQTKTTFTAMLSSKMMSNFPVMPPAQ